MAANETCRASTPAPTPIRISVSPCQDPVNSPPETPRRRTAAIPGLRIDRSPIEESRHAISIPTRQQTCTADTSTISRTTSFAWHGSPTQPQFQHNSGMLKSSGLDRERETSSEEKDSLLNNGESSTTAYSRDSEDSVTSASTTSLILENLNRTPYPGKPTETFEYRDDDSDPELPRWKGDYGNDAPKAMSARVKWMIWGICFIAVAGWSVALVTFLVTARYEHASKKPFDHESPIKGSGKRVSLNDVQQGWFSPAYKPLDWIAGANGEDGMLLEIAQAKKDYLVVEDVRRRRGDPEAYASKTLLKSVWQNVNGKQVYAQRFWPSPDLTKVLIVSEIQGVYRHSYTGVYYIVDVESQKTEPLDPQHPGARVQLAQWAPTSDSIAFTRENNMFVRTTASTTVRQITKDGGPEYFYGIPDWTYEEEVFQTNVATWWARDGQHIAFMRTNETTVPEYPVQFFMKRPQTVETGLENYPVTTQIKYPKAGAPNPHVRMLFYDVSKEEVFEVDINGGFADDDRLIADVMWSDNGHCLIRNLNRVSDRLSMVLVDTKARTGKIVRTENVKDLDGGWFEPGQHARYVPADATNGRPQDGYVDVVVHGDNQHFAYFTPIDNPKPLMLTTGNWDVDPAEEYIVDLEHNILSFVAAKEQPTSRHIYTVDLGGKEVKPMVPVDKPAYYGVKFSANGGYAVMVNAGPGIPVQSIVSTPSNPIKYDEILEENKSLANKATSYELPHKVWSNVTIDGFTLQVMERRPPHFDPKKKYPVLFQQYSGPGSQSVNYKFNVDFQSYIASSLEYIVVTVDGRGTGFIGRKAMCITRGHLGKYEATDQIETAKIWAQKPYVDADRIAIWGWSYGGFTTLKTLEMDAGQTFKYGMAVAPVTDWRFYDSIYTERYMFKPQDNQAGYENSAINDVKNISQNVRFLLMHGTGDDNVHMQNSLSLIDKLDVAGITNYDVHFFPDSNHNIAFHGANRVVYEKLEKWLVSAFNGAWYKYDDPKPERLI